MFCPRKTPSAFLAVWLLGFFTALSSFANAERLPIRTYTIADGLPHNDINRIVRDSRGFLWFCTGEGLSRFDGYEFTNYGVSEGLPHPTVNNLLETRSGDYWIATNSGLCKFNPKGLPTTRPVYAYGYVLGDKRASVFEGGKLDVMSLDSVEYWFSMGHFDGQRFSWIAPRAWDNNGWTAKPYIIQSSSGEWWVGQNNGLYLVPRVKSFAQLKTARPVAIYSTKDGLPSRVVYSIYEDRHGDLWVSTFAQTGNGLARWDRATRRIVDLTRREGLPSLKQHLAATFAEDRTGNIWVGFHPDGLARYASDRFTYFTVDNGLPDGRINDLHLDDAGRLWVATSRGGISRIDNPDSERPTFVNYTTEQGLSSNVTTVLTDDLYGRIYVGLGGALTKSPRQRDRSNISPLPMVWRRVISSLRFATEAVCSGLPQDAGCRVSCLNVSIPWIRRRS